MAGAPTPPWRRRVARGRRARHIRSLPPHGAGASAATVGRSVATAPAWRGKVRAPAQSPPWCRRTMRMSCTPAGSRRRCPAAARQTRSATATPWTGRRRMERTCTRRAGRCPWGACACVTLPPCARGCCRAPPRFCARVGCWRWLVPVKSRCLFPSTRTHRTLTPVCLPPLGPATTRRDYAPMPHLDQFALSELASESEPLGDFSEEQGARLSAEREMAERDRREGRLLGRGVRRPGALMVDDDGACGGGVSRQRGLDQCALVSRLRTPSDPPTPLSPDDLPPRRRRRRRTADRMATGALEADDEEVRGCGPASSSPCLPLTHPARHGVGRGWRRHQD